MQSLDGDAEEAFKFLDTGKGYVEDLGNGHSVMVMIPSASISTSISMIRSRKGSCRSCMNCANTGIRRTRC